MLAGSFLHGEMKSPRRKSRWPYSKYNGNKSGGKCYNFPEASWSTISSYLFNYRVRDIFYWVVRGSGKNDPLSWFAKLYTPESRVYRPTDDSWKMFTVTFHSGSIALEVLINEFQMTSKRDRRKVDSTSTCFHPFKWISLNTNTAI